MGLVQSTSWVCRDLSWEEARDQVKGVKKNEETTWGGGERIKHFIPLSSLFPFLSSSDTTTSSPPSMPLPLCLSGRMMMNRLAARKQNISSQGRFGNWLSTSAEPWPHNRFEPARTSWFIKQPLINALLSGQGRLKTQRPDHSNMNSTCKKKDRSACVCVCLADGIARSRGESTAVKGNCGSSSPVKSTGL